jgi:hypothetical protein
MSTCLAVIPVVAPSFPRKRTAVRNKFCVGTTVSKSVIPAKAGIQSGLRAKHTSPKEFHASRSFIPDSSARKRESMGPLAIRGPWIPAFAGMTASGLGRMARFGCKKGIRQCRIHKSLTKYETHSSANFVPRAHLLKVFRTCQNGSEVSTSRQVQDSSRPIEVSFIGANNSQNPFTGLTHAVMISATRMF